jgi:2-polyprenyl-3-methyl-5-hydroxy-6-metoxy-1,4-benzoquinol methylase
MKYNFVKESSGYVRIDPLPSATELAEYYASDYYQNPHGTYSSTYTSQELQHKRIRNEFLFHVFTTGIIFNEASKFLDVGCGEGFLLSTFAEKGWDTLGLDFSAFGIGKFNPHLTGRLIVGDIYDSLDSLISQNKKFDCINLGNVLEHVLNPISLLTNLKKLMHDSSVLAITVPNDFSRLQVYLHESKTIEKQYWIAVPDHLNYFSYKSLRETAAQAGLDSVDVLADFPIEWFLANENSNYSINPTAGKAAHFARVTLDSLITSEYEFGDVKNFWSAMARVGQGRVITLVCKSSDS